MDPIFFTNLQDKLTEGFVYNLSGSYCRLMGSEKYKHQSVELKLVEDELLIIFENNRYLITKINISEEKKKKTPFVFYEYSASDFMGNEIKLLIELIKEHIEEFQNYQIKRKYIEIQKNKVIPEIKEDPIPSKTTSNSLWAGFIEWFLSLKVHPTLLLFLLAWVIIASFLSVFSAWGN